MYYVCSVKSSQLYYTFGMWNVDGLKPYMMYTQLFSTLNHYLYNSIFIVFGYIQLGVPT